MEKRSYKTDRELKALKPSGKWYDVKDEQTRNLIVRVGPENSKGEFRRTFCLVTRFPGSSNPVRHAFGEYKDSGSGDLTLEQARALADEWRGKIRNGIDPREEIRQAAEANRKATQDATQEAERANQNAFGIVVEKYIKTLKGQRRGKVAEYEIRKEIIPVWKDKMVSEISRFDVKELIEAIVERAPAGAHARNVLGHIKAFFNWAIDDGDTRTGNKYGLEFSPAESVKPKKLTGEKKPRLRVLSDDELVAFWRATGRMAYPYGPLFRFLLLTGVRKDEAAEARWSEIDLAKRLWTVPPERFKSDVPHLVHLSDDAVALLEGLPRFTGKNTGDHIFSTTFGVKPSSSLGKPQERQRKHVANILKAMARRRGAPISAAADFHNHDLKRTVRTRLSSLKVPSNVAEMVAGHGKKGLERTYDQYEYADEMRDALEKWARKLREIVSPPPAPPANVTDLAIHRARERA